MEDAMTMTTARKPYPTDLTDAEWGLLQPLIETPAIVQEKSMTRIRGVWHWKQIVSTHLPCLSRPQVATLARWSLGIVLMQSAGLTTVPACIALLPGQAEPTVRERLRYWHRVRTRVHKKARKAARRCSRRRDTTVQTCFAPLLRWVVAWWHPDHKALPLVLDASTLGQPVPHGN
jgi:hypothetical protein